MKSETGKKGRISLKGKQKKILRGLGHHLNPVVHIGREGISENLAETARDAFRNRELIKIKLGQNCTI
ncbi:MAG: YhbY family RNA-binding protein, partial [Candidatus Electrothrix sp. AR3]|nr:YhbY family RNA-binding protein [Candidatus Electrothrix sp. AR3]